MRQRTPPLRRCVVDAVGEQPAYFDLNWTSVHNHTALPAVFLTLRTPAGDPLTAEFPDGTCKPVQHLDLGPLPAGSREQFVLQLFAPKAGSLRALNVTLAGRHARLPLVPTCGDGEQPASMDCTVDPVTYGPGSPYSIDVNA
jgi:hypothetical protein